MKKQISLLSSVLLTFLFAAAAAFGQIGSGAAVPRGLKNKPYSAEVTRETVQTLADGNKITRIVKSLEYRDSEGRTRREEVSQTPPLPFTSFTSISIFDPVAGYTYSLIPAQKTAYRTRLLTPAEIPALNTASRPPGYLSQREPLGSRIIEGIETNGTRFRTTIAPGTLGNEKEIQTIGETWFSPELSLTLLSISDDPRYGVATTRLTNIKRGEPDKSLFEIPAGYKITDREPLRPALPAPTPTN